MARCANGSIGGGAREVAGSSWPVNAGKLEDIDKPEYPERHEWACSLAYASWSAEEFDSIDFRDYHYTTKEIPCA